MVIATENHSRRAVVADLYTRHLKFKLDGLPDDRANESAAHWRAIYENPSKHLRIERAKVCLCIERKSVWIRED